MRKPYKVLLTAISLSVICFSCAVFRGYDPEDPGTFRYFEIYVCIDDDSVFLDFQKEMKIDPLLSNYILTVNLLPTKCEDKYVSMGEDYDPSAIRMEFYRLDKKTRNKLRNWTARNKRNLEGVRRYYLDKNY